MNHRIRTLVLLLALWAGLVVAALFSYTTQPNARILGLLISWFGGLVSTPLLHAIYVVLEERHDMSKADDLRAMRERNWHARQKGAAVQTPAQKKAAAAQALADALGPKPEVTEVCGKTGIGGKTCIRQAGHSEKQHKYGSSTGPSTPPT